MLVLTRKMDEQIVIGDQIKLTVLRVRGNTVRIGIEAPRDIRIVRGELERHEQHTVDLDLDASDLGLDAVEVDLDASDLDLDASEATSDLEAVFAHPVPQRSAQTPKPASARVQPDHSERSAAKTRGADDNQVFVGSVDRQGNRPRLQRAAVTQQASRAPLAHWVTAN